MAKRIVVIECDMDDVKLLRESYGDTYDVLGEYMSPQAYCRCGRKPDAKNWVKGRRSGLFLCTKCKLPSRSWRAGIKMRLEQALGRDQLTLVDE